VFATGLLITVEALHLHSDQSMRKHDDYAAWFACIAAGSLAGYPLRALKGVAGNVAVVVGVTALAVASGIHYSARASSTYEAHPNVGVLNARGPLYPYLNHSGTFLLGGLTDDALLYSDHLGIPPGGVTPMMNT
jgi:hypothetical protein